MAWQIRKRRRIGPFQVTASKKGVGLGVGGGPLRVSRGSDGRVRRTVRVLGLPVSIFNTKVVGGRRKARA